MHRLSALLTGSLVVVGTGIGFARITLEARAAIAAADEVLYLVPDPSRDRYRGSESECTLAPHCYEEGASHHTAYERIAEAILEPVRAGKRVCAGFYGHPGVFVRSHDGSAAPGPRASRHMLPGVSAEDCLAWTSSGSRANGLQSYEAGDFLHRQPVIEPTTALVLWQIGVVGARTQTAKASAPALAELVELLLRATRPATEQWCTRRLPIRRPADRPRSAARRARSGQGHPRVNAVRAASSSLSARARRAATTPPFASKSCCARTARPGPPLRRPRPRAPPRARVAPRPQTLASRSCRRAPRRRLRSLPPPGHGRAGREPSRARRATRSARGASGEDASSLVNVAASASSGRPARAAPPRAVRRPKKIRALTDLLELFERGTKLSFSCDGISGQQLHRARPRRDRSSADAAAEGVEDLLPFLAARARIVERAGHRGEQARRDEQEPLDRTFRRCARDQLVQPRAAQVDRQRAEQAREAEPDRDIRLRRGSSARCACSSARSRVSSIGRPGSATSTHPQAG